MKYLLKLLSQPSTAAGFSSLLGVVYAAIYSGMPLSVAVPAGIGAVYAMLKHDGDTTATPPAK